MRPPQETGQPASRRRSPSSKRSASAGLLILGVLLVAANLRPTLTGVGPLLSRIGDDTGLSAAALGLLGALPLIAFGAVSPLAHRFSQRFGMERTVLTALLVLAAGTVLRSLGGSIVNLWVGTAIIGSAIAVGNVLLPAILKRDFPERMSTLTGAYSAVLGSAAAMGAGLAVPIAHLGPIADSGADWRIALALLGLPVIPALAVWLPRLREEPAKTAINDGGASGRRVPIWKSPLAWQVTLYMGMQSMTFYVLTTWLPTIAVTFGRSPVEAGWDLFLYQGISVLASLATPVLLNRGRDQRFTAILPPAMLVAAFLGLIFLPGGLVAWVLIAGIASGSQLVTALSLFGLRTRTHHEAGALSGMAQSLGYLLAAAGPFFFGAIFGAVGHWTLPLVVLGLVVCGQIVVGSLVGRNRFLHA